MKKIVAFLMAAVLLLSLAACGQKTETVEAQLVEAHDGMFKYGHLYFNLPADTLLSHFELGDVVTVTVAGCAPLDVPVCASYDDVPNGAMLLRAVSGQEHIVLAINYGQMGLYLGVMQETEGAYQLRDDLHLPLTMSVRLKEKGGYKDQLALSTLVRSDVRTDYAPALSDEAYANFRAVSTTGMGENRLYRSSSPVNDWNPRIQTAAALAEKAGIRCFVNLSDNEAQAPNDGAYYATQEAVYCDMPAAVQLPAFSEGLAKGLRFLSAHEGPYLLHCVEGKDRAGFVAAVLELFMGAPLEEVQEDYLRSYENYYAPLQDGGEQLTESLRIRIRGLIVDNLELAYGVADLSAVDTVKATEDYLRAIGLSDAELSALRSRLG